MVKRNSLKILWDKEAKSWLKNELSRIRKESPKGAKIVKDKILKNIRLLPDQPGLFEKDKLKINNDGSYRRFFAFNYRISYRITSDAILILRIRHTSQEPLEF